MTTHPKRIQREDEEYSGGGTDSETLKPMVPQDTYRKVLFGQASDPLFPPHPEPPEVSESELSKLALSDPLPLEPDADRPGISMLHWLLLAVIAIAVLGFLFYCRSG